MTSVRDRINQTRNQTPPGFAYLTLREVQAMSGKTSDQMLADIENGVLPVVPIMRTKHAPIVHLVHINAAEDYITEARSNRN